jgi:hypothetical protein
MTRFRAERHRLLEAAEIPWGAHAHVVSAAGWTNSAVAVMSSA